MLIGIIRCAYISCTMRWEVSLVGGSVGRATRRYSVLLSETTNWSNCSNRYSIVRCSILNRKSGVDYLLDSPMILNNVRPDVWSYSIPVRSRAGSRCPDVLSACCRCPGVVVVRCSPVRCSVFSCSPCSAVRSLRTSRTLFHTKCTVRVCDAN